MSKDGYEKSTQPSSFITNKDLWTLLGTPEFSVGNRPESNTSVSTATECELANVGKTPEEPINEKSSGDYKANIDAWDFEGTAYKSFEEQPVNAGKATEEPINEKSSGDYEANTDAWNFEGTAYESFHGSIANGEGKNKVAEKIFKIYQSILTNSYGLLANCQGKFESSLESSKEFLEKHSNRNYSSKVALYLQDATILNSFFLKMITTARKRDVEDSRDNVFLKRKDKQESKMVVSPYLDAETLNRSLSEMIRKYRGDVGIKSDEVFLRRARKANQRSKTAATRRDLLFSALNLNDPYQLLLKDIEQPQTLTNGFPMKELPMERFNQEDNQEDNKVRAQTKTAATRRDLLFSALNLNDPYQLLLKDIEQPQTLTNGFPMKELPMERFNQEDNQEDSKVRAQITHAIVICVILSPLILKYGFPVLKKIKDEAKNVYSNAKSILSGFSIWDIGSRRTVMNIAAKNINSLAGNIHSFTKTY